MENVISKQNTQFVSRGDVLKSAWNAYNIKAVTNERKTKIKKVSWGVNFHYFYLIVEDMLNGIVSGYFFEPSTKNRPNYIRALSKAFI